VAADRLELLAKTAAKRYLEEGAVLNDTIKKIAEDNDLNRHQIERVCEMANIATHQGLWAKTAEKESVAFPLADSKAVVTVVKKTPLDSDDPESPKVSPSSCDSDYMGPPKGIPTPGPSMVSMMGADPANVHNGLHEEPEKKRIIIILQKKAAERARLESEILYKGMQLESLEKKAFAAFKQSILGGDTLYDVSAAAAGAGLGKVAGEYFPKWHAELVSGTHGEMRNRLEKQAIARAPDDLISENLGNVAIINGAHPVLISLDTVQRKTGEIKQGLNNLLRIDDQVKVFHQKIRDLS
jgi:hypothetical protein